MKRFLTLILVVSLLAGIAPAAAMPGDTTATPTPEPTATPTPSQNSGGNQSSASKGGVRGVEVYVEQPRFVSKTVKHSLSDGIHTYTVRGAVHELDPEGFNASDVVRSGVREDSATLKYDKGIERWILNSQGTSGTYRVFWVVREGGGTTTYAANVQVAQATYKHVAPSRWQAVNDKANNWEWTISQFAGADLVNSDAGVEKVKSVIEDAVTWYKFYDSPFSALSGQFMTLGLMLVRWPAGWIILGTLFLLFFIHSRKKTRQNRRFKRQFSRIEDVDDAERRAEERELKRVLSMKNFTDLGLSESDAEAIREHCDADNPRQFLGRLRDMLSEQRMVGLLLSAHEQLGDRIRVERDALGAIEDVALVAEPLADDRPLADGGAVAEDGADEPSVTYLAPSEADEDVILALDWLELNPDILWSEHVDPAELDLPIANDAEAEDLVSEWGIPIGEDGHDYYILERREEFAELLVTFIRNVGASEYTDEDGRIRQDADLVDFLYTFTSVGAEKYRWPLHHTRDILLRCRQLLDANDRMEDVADRSQQGEL